MRPSPLLSWPGAVAVPEETTTGERPGDGAGARPSPDAAVPAHYGRPLREQEHLLAGAALSALARDVVTVTGAERLSWLTTLSSQVHTGLGPGHPGLEALVMDAHGHVRHAFASLDDGTTLHLVTEAGRGPALVDFLVSMRFMLQVEVELREDLMALGAMSGGLEALSQAASETGALRGAWCDPWPGPVESGTAYDIGLGAQGQPFQHPGASWVAGLVLVPTSAVGEVVRRFKAARQDGAVQGGADGDGLAGSLAWEALRVEAGRPRLAREVDERTIPHELDWLRTAVHLDKGCYPGQETVARTLNLGRPPRRLTLLQLDGADGLAPSPGAGVYLGPRAVGRVTSVAQHHELGPVALALLRRNLPLDAQLEVAVEPGDGRVAAVQEPLVGPEGKAGASLDERPGAGLRRGLLR